MASIKLKFRPSTVADLEGTIYFQIIHNRKPRQLLTEYRVMPCEWDERRSTILIFPDSKRKALLLSIRERIQLDIERLSRIIKKYDVAELEYSADDVIREFNRHSIEYSLFSFFNNIIEKLKQNAQQLQGIPQRQRHAARLYFLGNNGSVRSLAPQPRCSA